MAFLVSPIIANPLAPPTIARIGANPPITPRSASPARIAVTPVAGGNKDDSYVEPLFLEETNFLGYPHRSHGNHWGRVKCCKRLRLSRDGLCLSLSRGQTRYPQTATVLVRVAIVSPFSERNFHSDDLVLGRGKAISIRHGDVNLMRQALKQSGLRFHLGILGIRTQRHCIWVVTYAIEIT